MQITREYLENAFSNFLEEAKASYWANLDGGKRLRVSEVEIEYPYGDDDFYRWNIFSSRFVESNFRVDRNDDNPESDYGDYANMRDFVTDTLQSESAPYWTSRESVDLNANQIEEWIGELKEQYVALWHEFLAENEEARRSKVEVTAIHEFQRGHVDFLSVDDLKLLGMYGFNWEREGEGVTYDGETRWLVRLTD